MRTIMLMDLAASLDKWDKGLKEFIVNVSKDPVVVSGIVLMAFIIGCCAISYFTSRG